MYSNLKENLFTVLETYDTKKEARQSSLIAPWLGIKRTPAGFSQRVGNYLEDLLALDMGEQNKLLMTDFKKGRNFMITHNGANHQIDMLAIPSNLESDLEVVKKIIHREIKGSTDVDAGKKRDILFRESEIKAWMESKGWEYDSGIFCPFFYDKGKNVSGLGWVDGLEWYIETFKPSWTVQDFKDLGRDPEVHRALGLID
jgi:hypothetical protein